MKSTERVNERIKTRGLYLAPPHGEWIATGRKTAIAKSRDFGLEGDWTLVSGKQAWGDLTLAEPEEVSLAEFDSRFAEHQVSVKARRRWWPEAESLWLYGVEGFEAYAEPRGVEVQPGVQTKMENLKFTEGQCEAGSRPVRFVAVVLSQEGAKSLDLDTYSYFYGVPLH